MFFFVFSLFFHFSCECALFFSCFSLNVYCFHLLSLFCSCDLSYFHGQYVCMSQVNICQCMHVCMYVFMYVCMYVGR